MTMRVCVVCGHSCRNRCSEGNHGFCSVCSKATHSSACPACIAAYNQRKAAARAALKQRKAAARAPVYVPSTSVQQRHPAQPIPVPQRRALFQMSESELEQWAKSIEAALSDMQARNDHYTQRRASRGTVTPTDLSLKKDNLVAEDIKEALTELIILWRMAHSGVSIGTSGPPTGTLIEYDYTNAKVTP